MKGKPKVQDMSAILKLRDILHDHPSRDTFWRVCEAVDASPDPEVQDYASAHLGEWPAEAVRGRGLAAVEGGTDPKVERLRVEAERLRAAVRRLEGAVEGRLPFWEDPYWAEDPYWRELLEELHLMHEACTCGKPRCDATCAEAAWWERFGYLHWQLQHAETHANHEWLVAVKNAAKRVSHAERLAREEAARLQVEAERVAARVAAAERKAKREASKARKAAKQAQSA